MTRRSIVVASLVLLAAGAGAYVLPRLLADRDATPPNVVFIIIDTLRADRITAQRNGEPVMPAMHAFAEKSWWFTHAVSQASWTKPSVLSMLTSLYPETHRVHFGVRRRFIETQQLLVQAVPESIETMASVFKKAGYTTAGFQTNIHLHEKFGFGKDFDTYLSAQGYLAPGEHMVDEVLGELGSLKEPYFIYLHLMDPHAPYDPPPAFRDIFGPLPAVTEQDEQLLKKEDFGGNYYMDKMLYDVGASDHREFGELTLAAREKVRQLYDGECRYVDMKVHTLIEAVRKADPHSVVVVGADHGEEFWEHGGVGHAKTVYDELVRVPLIMSIPGARPSVIDTPVQNIDILPTLAGCLGLPRNPLWQGMDLSSPDPAKTVPARPAFSYTRGSIPEFGLYLESVTDGDHKLIVDHRACGRKLYDIDHDPGETVDLAAEDPDTVSAKTALIQEHFRAANAHPLAETHIPVVSLEPDSPEMENLEALGYVQASDPASGYREMTQPHRCEDFAATPEDMAHADR